MKQRGAEPKRAAKPARRRSAGLPAASAGEASPPAPSHLGPITPAPSRLGPMPPPDLEVTSFSVGDREYAIFRFDVAEPGEPPPSPANMTAAEWAVVRLVVDGRSNQDIATERGVAVRTIINQLSSVYRKLGVNSRTELALWWARQHPPSGQGG
jgi:DNA-binding CsgD family transcriptional regulator